MKNDKYEINENSESGSDRLEGRNPISEAIKAGRTIDKVWVARREGKPDAALARLLHQIRMSGAVIQETERSVLDRMAETRNHQGIIAQVAAHKYKDLDQLLGEIDAAGEKPFLLILSEIQDSYNLGSILRIADAAGVHGVIIPQRRSIGLNAAVARASAGAVEHVPVVKVNNISTTMIQLKKMGFWITGTDADGDTLYSEADWKGSTAILIGGEGSGLAPSLRKHCDFLVSIPMRGRVNSLNAAVAAGIIVFAAAKDRGNT